MTLPAKPTPPPNRDSLSVEIGSFFKARATGAGVIAIPLILVLLALAAAAERLLP